MTAILAAFKAVLVDWLTGAFGELVRQWRHDRATRQNAILKTQLKSRKAIDRAQANVNRRNIGAVRERLRKHARHR